MGSRTDFEIRHESRGFFVRSITSWWTDESSFRNAGGQTLSTPFAALKDAEDWVLEQFRIPLDAWTEESLGVFVASKGDEFHHPA